jgi:hypothetical protein
MLIVLMADFGQPLVRAKKPCALTEDRPMCRPHENTRLFPPGVLYVVLVS